MAKCNLPTNFFKVQEQRKGNLGKPWSGEQFDIFEWFEGGEGNLIIRARAGCAKTTSIIEGVNRAPERRILLAAFNKVIAEELQNRITNHNARAQTLHSLGMSFCRRHIAKLEVDTKGDRARALAKRAIAHLEAGKKTKNSFNVVAEVANLHTKIREILVDPNATLQVEQNAVVDCDDHVERLLQVNLAFCNRMEQFAVEFGAEGDDNGFWSLSKVVEAALLCIEFAKEETSTIDFADMIFLPLVHNWAFPVCDLLAVDEAQDMTEAQLRLAMASVAPNGRICICGDDKQAIYGFRGADSGCLDRLKAELHAQELGLKTTYRCPQAIVKLAQHFVPDFVAAPETPQGEVRSLNDVSQLVELAQPGDFVLSRVNAKLVPVCLELIRGGKKAFVRGKEFGREVLKLLGRFEIDAKSKFALCTDPVKALRLLSKELAKMREREVINLQLPKEKGSAAKTAKLLETCELLAAFVEGSKSTIDLRDKIEATFSDVPHPDAIVCSSVHKAKGLEADHVFLLGATFSRGSDEEDNICYVAATRAKKALFIHGKTVRQFIRIETEDEPLWDGHIDLSDAADLQTTGRRHDFGECGILDSEGVDYDPGDDDNG